MVLRHFTASAFFEIVLQQTGNVKKHVFHICSILYAICCETTGHHMMCIISYISYDKHYNLCNSLNVDIHCALSFRKPVFNACKIRNSWTSRGDTFMKIEYLESEGFLRPRGKFSQFLANISCHPYWVRMTHLRWVINLFLCSDWKFLFFPLLSPKKGKLRRKNLSPNIKYLHDDFY